MTWQNVLLKPVISERSLEKVKESNEYAFLVGLRSTKTQIKEAIEKTFNVKAKKIRTRVLSGKVKRKGTKKALVSLRDLKQAVVKLADGDKIGLFEAKEEKKKK